MLFILIWIVLGFAITPFMGRQYRRLHGIDLWHTRYLHGEVSIINYKGDPGFHPMDYLLTIFVSIVLPPVALITAILMRFIPHRAEFEQKIEDRVPRKMSKLDLFIFGEYEEFKGKNIYGQMD
jgi:hypothetical protein